MPPVLSLEKRRTPSDGVALLLWGALVGALFFGVAAFAWVAWALWSI